jgi:hypothetical protein
MGTHERPHASSRRDDRDRRVGGLGGGKGSLYVSDLALQELPPPLAPGRHRRSAHRRRGGGRTSARVRRKHATAWHSNPSSGREQWLTMDFGQPREFGGLIVHWANGEFASRYDVQFSDDGRKWQLVRRVSDGGAGRAALMLTESETRYVRLALHDGPRRAYAISEIDIKASRSAPRRMRSSKRSHATPRAAISARVLERAGRLDARRRRWQQR